MAQYFTSANYCKRPLARWKRLYRLRPNATPAILGRNRVAVDELGVGPSPAQPWAGGRNAVGVEQ